MNVLIGGWGPSRNRTVEENVVMMGRVHLGRERETGGEGGDDDGLLLLLSLSEGSGMLA